MAFVGNQYVTYTTSTLTSTAASLTYLATTTTSASYSISNLVSMIYTNDPYYNPNAPPPVIWEQRMDYNPAPAPSGAVARARELFVACLSPDQVSEFEQQSKITVISRSSGRKWRITARGRSGNLELLDDQGVLARYCAHPPGDMPEADAWLAQKLTIESDEDHILRVANVMWRRPGAVLPAASQALAA